ncbi:hypothetical protein RO3G_06206 [Rhizopus delemar RA 99-880]|uniref:Uncharacterized protein n=1 Tax=Rhizopus delemar (strain RA 99-880 / ATCC MYA-4621 / FGSC 9543 / NRRL 43880) TaxID=246409 RepID=I1BZ71_RHIO9|nr:hypothetical protein RO3G_06206 [Rhizopus delemar RA 99-880]|eukprot:EIE81501.1 hypothetical protein RO3G_06206 [Rhizopus delemar RA 99-880]
MENRSRQLTLVATRHCHEKNLDRMATAMGISRIIITPPEIIYYGVKACPVDHFKAFYRFAQTFITLNLLAYIRFPLRRSRSPFFATINSKILCQKILDLTWINGIDKIVLWRGVVNLNNPLFRDQDRNLRFLKTIQTGGVSVILLKKRFGTQGRYSSRCTAQCESTRYLESLPSAN